MEGMKVDAFARNIQLQHSPNLPMDRLKAGTTNNPAPREIRISTTKPFSNKI
jgi:hypothetical protein